MRVVEQAIPVLAGTAGDPLVVQHKVHAWTFDAVEVARADTRRCRRWDNVIQARISSRVTDVATVRTGSRVITKLTAVY